MMLGETLSAHTMALNARKDTTSLEGGIFNGVDFGPIMPSAPVYEICLDNASMHKAILRKARCMSWSLQGVDARFLKINTSILYACNFRNSRIRGAQVTNSSFQGCDFSGADLRHMIFINSSMEDCIFDNDSKLDKVRLYDTGMYPATLPSHYRLSKGVIERL